MVSFQAACVNAVITVLFNIQPNLEEKIADVQFLIASYTMEYLFLDLWILRHRGFLEVEILKPIEGIVAFR
jgi:hypothetical protein